MQSKKFVRRGLLGAALALAMTAAPVPAGEADSARPASFMPTHTWKAVAASGTVEYSPAEQGHQTWQRIVRGDELEPLSMVKTGRRGRATLTRNGNVLIVDPKSQLELPETMESTVVQTRGSVLYEVDGKKNPHFEVVTPYLVAGVKGTVFLVTVGDDYTSVTVDRGTVEVTDSDTGRTLEVQAGEAVFHEGHGAELHHVDRRDPDNREARKETQRIARMEKNEQRDAMRTSRFDGRMHDRKQRDDRGMRPDGEEKPGNDGPGWAGDHETGGSLNGGSESEDVADDQSESREEHDTALGFEDDGQGNEDHQYEDDEPTGTANGGGGAGTLDLSEPNP